MDGPGNEWDEWAEQEEEIRGEREHLGEGVGEGLEEAGEEGAGEDDEEADDEDKVP